MVFEIDVHIMSGKVSRIESELSISRGLPIIVSSRCNRGSLA